VWGEQEGALEGVGEITYEKSSRTAVGRMRSDRSEKKEQRKLGGLRWRASKGFTNIDVVSIKRGTDKQSKPRRSARVGEQPGRGGDGALRGVKRISGNPGKPRRSCVGEVSKLTTSSEGLGSEMGGTPVSAKKEERPPPAFFIGERKGREQSIWGRRGQVPSGKITKYRS